MKAGNVIVTTLLTILVGFNLFLVNRNRELSGREAALQNALERADMLIQAEQDLSRNMMSIFYSALKSEGASIPKNMVMTDVDGKSVRLESIINNATKKVYFVPEYSCDVCYDSLVAKLRDVSKVSRDIIAICPITKTRDISGFFKDKSIEIPVFGIESRIEIPPYEGYAPFFFLIDRDFRIQNIHIPIKDRFFLTDAYLRFAFK